jgi:hypothetical protein
MVGPTIYILLLINQIPLLLCLEETQMMLQKQTGNIVDSRGNKGCLRV